MRDASNAFLLSLAGISATLPGTFTLGVFFYLNSSLHHERGPGAAADRYMRSPRTDTAPAQVLTVQ